MWECRILAIAFFLKKDTLEEKKFEFISKRKGFQKVLNSIESALEYGYLPKINCVVMRGLNDNEICNFIEMTKEKNVDIRFIEYMPFDGKNINLNFYKLLITFFN